MIVKVGGSVAEDLGVVVDSLKIKGDALIVPGGWKFADIVRELDEKYRINRSLSHWMAISAMNIYGYFISNYGVDHFEPESFEEIELKGVRVLLPYRILRKYDELPHSWDVTSDSISVWVAAKLGVEEVVKVTKVGGIIVDREIVDEVLASDLRGETCVDRYTPHLLKKYKLNMFVCSPKELKNYILRGRARGTLIKGR